MLRFGLHDMKKHGPDKVRKQIVVNYANAEKLAGRMDSAEEILSRDDWSASTNDYVICVAAVRDDIDSVIKLMKSAVEAELLEISAFRSWPVFKNVSSNPKFIEVFEKEFVTPKHPLSTVTPRAGPRDRRSAWSRPGGC